MEKEKNEKAILVTAVCDSDDLHEAKISLTELSRLLDTAGGETFATVIQQKEKPDVRTCIGSGKVKEVSELCRDHDIHLVIFDLELTPSQIKNLEQELGDDIEVIDRNMLILDIFALHAVTAEGKLQVELAQLKYTAPRLLGKGKEMSRLGGGIGTRGPGESKLETDRRHLKERVNTLQQRLKELEQKRSVMRAARDRSGLPKAAIVGYTNAGKSTLLNYLTDAGVLSEDKLFATLDATTRRLTLDDGQTVLLTDTVGFIRNLPHQLIKAFRSTLDEVTYSDIIIHVADSADPELAEHMQVTDSLLSDLGAADKPCLTVFNKCDTLQTVPHDTEDTVYVSALTGRGMESFTQKLKQTLSQAKKECELLIPYDRQSIVSILYEQFTVLCTEYMDDGIYVKAILDKKAEGKYSEYLRSR